MGSIIRIIHHAVFKAFRHDALKQPLNRANTFLFPASIISIILQINNKFTKMIEWISKFINYTCENNSGALFYFIRMLQTIKNKKTLQMQ